jgi:hypothetical protein
MWIGIMICGIIFGRGEKETSEENTELPQVVENTRVESRSSLRSRQSGESPSLASSDQD